jgi:hypothetical protein
MLSARSLQHKGILERANDSSLSAYVTSLTGRNEFSYDGRLDIMLAGQQGRKFNVRVRYFSWSEFYDRFGGMAIFEAMFDWMVETYDYVLIDSLNGRVRASVPFPFLRTDRLVVCFTLDRDSIKTSARMAAFIRSKGGELQVYPVPMRVQDAERNQLERMRVMAQQAFVPYLTHLPQRIKEEYWNTVEVPEVPYYSFANELPPLRDAPGDPKTISAAYDRLMTYLTDAAVAKADPRDEKVAQSQTPRGSSDERDGDWEAYVRPYEGEGVYGFVSYARNDVDMVMPIVQDIGYLDYHLWWDEGIPGAIEWLPHLEEKIKQAKYFLLFLSNLAVVSTYVQREVEIARQNRKPILAIRLDGISLQQPMAELLGDYQILDASGFAFEENLGKTLRLMHPPAAESDV